MQPDVVSPPVGGWILHRSDKGPVHPDECGRGCQDEQDPSRMSGGLKWFSPSTRRHLLALFINHSSLRRRGLWGHLMEWFSNHSSPRRWGFPASYGDAASKPLVWSPASYGDAASKPLVLPPLQDAHTHTHLLIHKSRETPETGD